MSSLSLIPVQIEDLGVLADIQKAAFRPLYEKYQDEGSPYLRDASEIEMWLRHPNVTYWKICLDDIVCGGIAYLDRGQGEYYLARLYIHPSYQGQGIASQAIAMSEDEFPNATHFVLDFPEEEVANRICYENAGYIDTGVRKRVNEQLVLAIYKKEVQSKHRKKSWIRTLRKTIASVCAFILLASIVLSKIQVIRTTEAVHFSNPRRTNMRIPEEVQVRQLAKRERLVYDQIMTKIANLEDGLVVFEEAITGREFLRIKRCVENYSQGTSIAYLSVPMTKKNVTATSWLPDQMEYENEPAYTQCVLLFYGGLRDFNRLFITNDNVVINVDEFAGSQIDREKVQGALDLEQQGRDILDTVIAQLPKRSGQRDAVIYFVDWIDTNLVYDHESSKKLEEDDTVYDTMDAFYEVYLRPSNLGCVTDGKALCLGFAKTLVYLCQGVGIEAEVVVGNVKQATGQNTGHAIAKVTIEDQVGYYDLTANWDLFSGINKSMSQKNVETKMSIDSLFE